MQDFHLVLLQYFFHHCTGVTSMAFVLISETSCFYVSLLCVFFLHRCLVKWLEVRCVCPMCNKPIAGPPEQHHSIGTLLDELV